MRCRWISAICLRSQPLSHWATEPAQLSAFISGLSLQINRHINNTFPLFWRSPVIQWKHRPGPAVTACYSTALSPHQLDICPQNKPPKLKLTGTTAPSLPNIPHSWVPYSVLPDAEWLSWRFIRVVIVVGLFVRRANIIRVWYRARSRATWSYTSDTTEWTDEYQSLRRVLFGEINFHSDLYRSCRVSLHV